jgi:vibriolysin
MAGALMTTVPATWAPAAQPTAAQDAALSALPALETALFDERAVPTFLAGRLGTFDLAQPERAAADLLSSLGPALRATQREELRPTSVTPDELGRTHVRLQQSIDGLEVVGGELVVQVDARTHEVLTVTGRFLPAGRLATTPALSEHAAALALRAVPSARRASLRAQPALAFVFGPDGAGRLAWSGTVEYRDADGEPQVDRVFVDAVSGAVLERHPQLHRALNREVWDAQNGTNAGGNVRLIQEGGPISTDTTAEDAYNRLGDAWTYFQARHGWVSWDGAFALAKATVHYGDSYNNAFWDAGARALAFGDCDGVTCSPLASGRDVVAHEFTHAVTGATAGLVYSNESGALNEAFSDVFAAAVEARSMGQSANTWRIGETVWTPSVAGDALRYMNNPTQDGSSRDYYPERYVGSADNGGVHWNSGIANLAFYLLSQGGTHPRGKSPVNVRPIGMIAAENIFFRALRFYLTSTSTFANARQATARAAWDLYGHNSQQHRSVCEAWDAVGAPGTLVGNCLTVGDGLAAPTSVNAESYLCYGWTDVSWSAAPGATRYEVYASVSVTDLWHVAGRIYSGAALSTTFNTDKGRYIRVKACDASGCGPFSLDYAWAPRYSTCL